MSKSEFPFSHEAFAFMTRLNERSTPLRVGDALAKSLELAPDATSSRWFVQEAERRGWLTVDVPRSVRVPSIVREFDDGAGALYRRRQELNQLWGNERTKAAAKTEGEALDELIVRYVNQWVEDPERLERVLTLTRALEVTPERYEQVSAVLLRRRTHSLETPYLPALTPEQLVTHIYARQGAVRRLATFLGYEGIPDPFQLAIPTDAFHRLEASLLAQSPDRRQADRSLREILASGRRLQAEAIIHATNQLTQQSPLVRAAILRAATKPVDRRLDR